MIKKLLLKVVLRKEIIRELSESDLDRVVGGIDRGAGVPQTGDKQCPGRQ